MVQNQCRCLAPPRGSWRVSGDLGNGELINEKRERARNWRLSNSGHQSTVYTRAKAARLQMENGARRPMDAEMEFIKALGMIGGSQI